MEHAEDTHQKGNKDKDNTDTPQTTYWLTESKQCLKISVQKGTVEGSLPCPNLPMSLSPFWPAVDAKAKHSRPSTWKNLPHQG